MKLNNNGHTQRTATVVVTCGPEGANLFVFHIPNDMSNLDLYNIFSVRHARIWLVGD